MPISAYYRTELLDQAFNNSAAPAVTSVFAKLHLGDPGTAGTSNAAANTTRQSVSFGNASGNTVTNDVAVAWTSVPNAETYAWLSLWDASTAGNHLWYGQLAAPMAVVVGQTFTIAIGALVVTLT